ncbi:hypothetical protein SBC1_43210 (plasmid) [Caballeronia sp. SBC1]|uniref:hypothetical protein n=1 Tax=unclassified Caballeronia TaxID=2646786 RepID=UPI0013E0ED89|nr:MULTISPECIES: hypothetical protein [unclassified Caballeronia]QIE26402.1 hypothetical protein SBC2_44720 [Caballeronia sp. SBC2]QIN64281.1 hypothetical protein SBC1_43210 [Caballeronia sp. SBC1]
MTRVTTAGRIGRGAWLGLFMLAAACGQQGYAQQEGKTMKASTTYLYLLRKTPFFTKLDTEQLRWTISHSREWEAQAGTVVADCSAADTRDDFWILLDGRWQVEHDDHTYPAGHADAGKWFSAAEASGNCRLVTTEHSYVMKITRADMNDMLSRGFAFESHMREGRAYYRTVFAAVPARD